MEAILRRLNSTHQVWYVDWLYGGVDFNIKGNGGEFCASYLPFGTRMLESAVMILIAALEIAWGVKRLTYEGHSEEEQQDEKEDEDSSSAFHLSSDNAPVAVDCVVRAAKNVESTRTK